MSYPKRPSLLHCLTTLHYSNVLLEEVNRLSILYRDPTEVANAYHKGEDKLDLKLATVYSRVVTVLTKRYEIEGVSLQVVASPTESKQGIVS